MYVFVTYSKDFSWWLAASLPLNLEQRRELLNRCLLCRFDGIIFFVIFKKPFFLKKSIDKC